MNITTGPAIGSELTTRGFRIDVGAVLCAAVAVMFLSVLWEWTRGLTIWSFEARRQFSLDHGELSADPGVAVDGHLQARRLWGGEDQRAVYLVDFIYTRCNSICSTLGSEFEQVQRALVARPGASSVHLVSLSFDPVGDDSAQLLAYEAAHHADPLRWTVGSAPSAEQTRRLLRSLQVVVVPDGFGGFVHNGDIHLLDADGRLQGLFSYDRWRQALEAAQALSLRSKP